MINKKSIAVVFILLGFGSTCFGLWYWLRSRAPHAPAEITLSTCRAMDPGTRRLGAGKLRTLFDVSDKDVTIRPVIRDMPPGQGYVVATKDAGTNVIEIFDGPLAIENELTSAFPVFSERVEERDVHNSSGQVIGKDRWGYLKSRDRWRHVKFVWGEEVGYRPVPPRVADQWDSVISSACLSSDSGHNSGY